MIFKSGGGGPGGQMSANGKSTMFSITPSSLLPKQAADLSGQVVSVKDNSIFVGQTDKFQMLVTNGQVQQQPTPSGPTTEVVVSKDTKIYRDVTMENMPTPSASSSGGTLQLQQQLADADISAVTANSSTFVQVWGQRRGDRLNADVIVVRGLSVIKGK
jgi:hypothetical protein